MILTSSHFLTLLQLLQVISTKDLWVRAYGRKGKNFTWRSILRYLHESIIELHGDGEDDQQLMCWLKKSRWVLKQALRRVIQEIWLSKALPYIPLIQLQSIYVQKYHNNRSPIYRNLLIVGKNNDVIAELEKKLHKRISRSSRNLNKYLTWW